MITPDQILLLPPPRKLELIGGTIDFPPTHALSARGRTPFLTTIRNELSARTVAPSTAANVQLHGADNTPRAWRRWAAANEGYVMSIDKNTVHIWSSSSAGHLYGAMTLRQLIAQYGRRIPCMIIGDSPALARRGIQLSFPQGHTAYRHKYMKHLVPQLARWKINELYLYLESYFDFPSLPHMAGPDAMTPANALSLDKLCRSYNIKLIPMLNTLAHCGEILATQKYQHLTEHKPTEDRRLVRPFNMCVSSKDVRTLVDNMLGDMLDCFSADVFHVGGDEVSCIGECPRCRRASRTRDPMKLYLKYYTRVVDVLHKHGRKGGIWGDMLLHHCEKLSPAQRKRFLAPLRDKVTIYDWHYTSGGRDSLNLFTRAGIDTIACSSTHLCYSSSMWPAQAVNQRLLFSDAIATGAAGGMTTAWGNFTGLQEEQFNYLHATGAVLLWSGPSGKQLARGYSMTRFERAYSLHRYNLRSTLITDLLHMLGDAKGPILKPLAPLHGVTIRKSLLHSVNILDAWATYSTTLSTTKLKAYRAGVAKAKRTWEKIQKDPAAKKDPYLKFISGPLLMHEHLIARFDMTEEVYRLYDAAAIKQYRDTKGFRALLERAATRLAAHSRDFAVLQAYLADGRRELGFDRSTINRVRATKSNMRELVALLRHLKSSHRPLPAFQQLYNVFLEPYVTRWYGDREHDWANETERFQRYSLNGPGPWLQTIADPTKE